MGSFLRKSVAFLYILATVLVNNLNAQTSKTDSLVQVLKTAKTDSVRLVILLQLARSYDFTEREKSIKYYEQALEYISDKHENAEILDTIGFYNWQLGNYEVAIKFYTESGILFSELKDSLWLGRVYNSIGASYWGLGKSNEALSFYQKAAKIRIAINDYTGAARALNNIGAVYRDWGMLEEGVKFNREALKYAQKEKNSFVLAFTYSNIGNFYEEIKNYDSALINYHIGYNYLLHEDEVNKYNSFFDEFFGNVYQKMGKLDSALMFYTKSMDYANCVNSKNRITIAKYNLAKTNFYLNNIDIAFRYALDSYTISVDNNYLSLQKDNLFLLADIEEKKGNIRGAYHYLKKASELNRALYNSEEIARFNELQKLYITEQHERENGLLKKDIEIQTLTIQRQNYLRYILVIITILFTVIITLIIKSRASLKRLNLKLMQSEKDLKLANINKDKFFAIIAHDLKSPFTGLIGITSLLAENYDALSSDRKKKMVVALNDSTSKVYALLESLLQWAQIQSGKMEYHFENFNLFALCNDTIEVHQPMALNKQISIENNIDRGIRVFADIKAVEAIFRNLISNALKFTNVGGNVTIIAKTFGHYVSVSINDTGIGMDEETLKNLFRIDVATSTKGTNNESGTGLGLILCKELIEKQNGKLEVQSEPGKGSTFTFTLPIR